MWIPGDWAVTWTMLVFEGHAATEGMLVSVACTTAWGHGDIWTQAAPRTMSGPLVGL